MITTTTTYRRCPLCKDWMPEAARFCGTCGRRLQAAPSPAGRLILDALAAIGRRPLWAIAGWLGLGLFMSLLLPRGGSDMPIMPNGKPAVAVHAYMPGIADWTDSEGVRWVRNDARTGWIRADGSDRR